MRALPVLVVTLAACSTELQHDLGEDDANEIYVALTEKGFRASKVREEGAPGLYAITVPKADIANATQVLTNRGLPRTREAGWSLITKNVGMIPTEIDQRALFIQALSGEVANTLKRIPKVIDARVIVNVPPANDLTQLEQKPAPSASVYVKHTGELGLTADQLKAFVAAAVPELKADAVNVVVIETKPPVDPSPANELLSVDALKGLVATLAALLVLVSAAALSFLFRLRRMRPAPAAT